MFKVLNNYLFEVFKCGLGGLVNRLVFDVFGVACLIVVPLMRTRLIHPNGREDSLADL